MPAEWGNATIGGGIGASNPKPVQYPVAVNKLPANSAGMGNAHIGANYNQLIPDDAQARLIAHDGTPGLDGQLRQINWNVAGGLWQLGVGAVGDATNFAYATGNRVICQFSPLDFNLSLTVGGTVQFTEVTGDPDAEALLNGQIVTLITRGALQSSFDLPGADAIDWSGVTATATKIS